MHIALISATWHADPLQGTRGSCKAAVAGHATTGDFTVPGALEQIR